MSILKNRKSLKFKLAISHISMILIPLVLFAAGDLFWHHIMYDRYSAWEEPKTEDIIKQNRHLTDELDNTIVTNPDKLTDVGYLQHLNKKAGQGSLAVIIEKDKQLIYIPEHINEQELKAAIMMLNSGSSPDENPHVYYLLKYRDFKFSDQSSGHIYFLPGEKPPGPGMDITLIGALLLGMIINMFISYRVAGSIITPLGILNKATEEISRGNLDCQIEYKSQDELGDLCQAFEKMCGQLKEAKALSQSYEKNRKELVANISHDLKTPITSIRGYVQGLMEGVASTPEKQAKYIRTIYTNAIEMDRLIDELFLFSKLDLKQLQFDFEAVDIEAYLRDCVEDKGYDLDLKGIKLNYTTQYTSHDLVQADRLRLQRVINNILVNAEQHPDPARQQTILEIKLSENSEDAVIEIKDNGIGIPEENLPYIFDRLYRGDPARNRQNKGSGLGLSIAKQIIEAHGGRIWAESKVNEGTSICFTLPKISSITPLGDDEEVSL